MADLLGTYEFDFNRPCPMVGVTTNEILTKAVAFTLVHQLLGDYQFAETGVRPTGAWSLVYCSNGYGSGGTHGALDYWWDRTGTFSSAKFDPSLMKHGTTTSNQQGCMMALRAPDAPCWGANRPTILLSFTPASGSYVYDWRWYVTGGIVTAPVTMGMLPNTTTQWATTASGGGNSDWALALDADTTQRNCHLSLATDGAFFWADNKNAIVGRMWNGCAVFPLLDAHSSDTNPWAFWRGGPTPGDTAADWPSINASAGNAGWAVSRFAGGGDPYGGGHTALGYALLGMRVNTTAGTGFSPVLMIFDALGRAYGDVSGYRTVLTSAGSIDAVRQTYPEFPVWVVDASFCIRGRLRDIWLCYPHAGGAVEPSGTGPVKRMCWGNFWVPSPDSATPIVW